MTASDLVPAMVLVEKSETIVLTIVNRPGSQVKKALGHRVLNSTIGEKSYLINSSRYQIYVCRSMIKWLISPVLIYLVKSHSHFSDVDVSSMVFQITAVLLACPTVCSGVDQRKYQSYASLAFVRGNHRRPMDSPNKGPVTRKMMTPSCTSRFLPAILRRYWFSNHQPIYIERYHSEKTFLFNCRYAIRICNTIHMTPQLVQIRSSSNVKISRNAMVAVDIFNIAVTY